MTNASRKKALPTKWIALAVAAIVLLGVSIAILRGTRSQTPAHADVAEATGTRAIRTAHGRVTLPAEEQALPKDIVERTSGWSPEPVVVPAPLPGEQARVTTQRFVPNQPPAASEPPNPFMPSKQHLSQEDIRSGVDRAW